jgi:hypothetical protein
MAKRGHLTGRQDNMRAEFYKKHREEHPNCTFGDQPHYVPPGFGDIGFFMCDVPEDTRNHTRCRPPFDHEHPDHFDMGKYMDQGS